MASNKTPRLGAGPKWIIAVLVGTVIAVSFYSPFMDSMASKQHVASYKCAEDDFDGCAQEGFNMAQGLSHQLEDEVVIDCTTSISAAATRLIVDNRARHREGHCQTAAAIRNGNIVVKVSVAPWVEVRAYTPPEPPKEELEPQGFESREPIPDVRTEEECSAYINQDGMKSIDFLMCMKGRDDLIR